MAYFLRLPRIVDLTAPQRAALNEQNAISLSGAPGTGKSVISVWRHINNYKSKKIKSILLTYTKSLKFYLSLAIQNEKAIADDKDVKKLIDSAYENVAKALSWIGSEFDEIIIDEAQDLKECGIPLTNCQVRWAKKSLQNNQIEYNEYKGKFCLNENSTKISSNNINFSPIGKWFSRNDDENVLYKIELTCNLKGKLRFFKKFAEKISYGADNNQILYPENATEESRIRQIFPFPHNKLFILDENYRNTYQILIFVKSIIKDLIVSFESTELLRKNERSQGPKPILKLVRNENEQNQAIVQIIKTFLSGVDSNKETHNIAILVPLKKPFKHIVRVVKGFYEYIKNEGIDVSFYTNDLVQLTNIANVHVTTFKSSKGLEFDTVIVPDFQFFEMNLTELGIVNEEDYYVAMTRAKKNLFLISDRELNFINKNLVEIETFTETDEDFTSNSNYSDDLPF